MQKAHLFEAVYRFNHGIDEAVLGVLRLRKAPELSEDAYIKGVNELELRRSRVNVQFLADLSERERADADRFGEVCDSMFDEPLVPHAAPAAPVTQAPRRKRA